MYLLKPFQGGTVIEMDSELVRPIRYVHSATVKTVGNAHETEGHIVALYADDGVLCLQIDAMKFNFKSKGLLLDYYHTKHTKETTFSVKHQAFDFHLKYPAWWSEIPEFEPMEPEMDQDEDFYGYLFSIWRNTYLQSELTRAWSSSGLT